jgi:glycosyltransferase involved in cell wall biosynthesis
MQPGCCATWLQGPRYVGLVKVLVLTTSYPRNADDPSGRFVADAVEGVRARGVEVEVVSPASFRHFGLAYGHGIVGNLGARPWLGLFVPAFLWSFRRAAVRAARDADLVHAHWLAAGAVALTLRRPYVVQVWGTDVELARHVPWLVRPILRRARLVIGASRFLADEARALGAREVRVVPSGVPIPESVGPPQEPPHVLFVGRLSEEKGILEFLEATEGMPRVIVGDGPLRARVSEAIGFVPPGELGAYYERAAVVCCPSRREGYGIVAREAMAWGRPVIATAVGGLVDAVDDVVTGLVVPVVDVSALRVELKRTLADGDSRARFGVAGREKARREFSWQRSTNDLVEVYAQIRAARR